MGRLHRTPYHVLMLDCVADNRIVWNPNLGGGGGGFAYHTRRKHLDFNERYALWDMLHAGLIAVDDTSVVVTAAGGERRIAWRVTA